MANLWETPSGERIHIGFLGLTNAGKSTWMNALTGKEMSLVSAVAGTTTDPVKKTMELLPLGPVLFIDMPGFGDESELGSAREENIQKALGQLHLAVAVVGNDKPLSPLYQEYFALLKKEKIPFLILVNDFGSGKLPTGLPSDTEVVLASPFHVADCEKVKEAIIRKVTTERLQEERSLTTGLVNPGDRVLLVIPQDVQAPKGRLILPQVQTIRDLLDKNALVTMVKLEQLPQYLQQMPLPDLVIVDSQVFSQVDALLPREVRLTSFSILMARYKGDIHIWLAGAKALAQLTPAKPVLIWEACTHHVQKGDIAREKLPQVLAKIAGAPLDIHCHSGKDFPGNICDYQLIVHCGGCMLNQPQVMARLRMAEEAGIPITNFGMVFAYAGGILDRVCY